MTIEIKPISEEEMQAIYDQYDEEAQSHGFKDFREFANESYQAQQGMIIFGGSFVRALGHALAHADTANKFKIYTTFHREWREHRALFLKSEKQKNRDTE